MIRVAGHDYTLDDVRGTVGGLGEWWLQLTTGRRPSAAEPAARSMARRVGRVLGQEPADDSIGVVLGSLGDAARRAVDADTAAPLMEATLTGVDAITEALRAAGQIAATGTGVVVQLSRSGGGVPKHPVPTVGVGLRGLEGDAQSARRHHGRPWQALCLWSKEVIDAFSAAGHPLGYGSAGENLTEISGLDWPEMRAGVRLRIGTVLAELSLFSVPCTKNSKWFLNGDHSAMHHDRGPVSRVYAWVREPGVVSVGDAVTVVA